jgi:SET domain-containing protein
LKKYLEPCHGISCPTSHSRSRNPDKLCECTEAPWSHRNNETWFSENISLTHTTARGIGAHTLTSLPANTVIGEYTGELISTPTESYNSQAYLFEAVGQGKTIAYIVGLRMGSWTRFINHSCKPNVFFQGRRTGRSWRYFIVTSRRIKKGEEVLVDYGKGYWDGIAEKRIFCKCGERGCKYSEGK